jgi:hypothetical protein
MTVFDQSGHSERRLRAPLKVGFICIMEGGSGGLMVGLRSHLFATRSLTVRLLRPPKAAELLAFSRGCFVDMEGVTGSIPVAPTI